MSVLQGGFTDSPFLLYNWIGTRKVYSMMGDISKYPNLERYYRHFEETNGQSERHDDSFPNFIIWIRLVVEPEDEGKEWTDVAQFFELDEDDAEDFHSWGHNSRWANVFLPFALHNMDLVKEKCIELAERFGDPNVEEYLKDDK